MDDGLAYVHRLRVATPLRWLPHSRSVANRDGARLHSLTDCVLGDPACIDDNIQIALGDGDRLQKNGGHLLLLRAVGESPSAFDVGELLAASKRDGDFGRVLSKLAGVLPDRDGLAAKRDAVKCGLIAILAWCRPGPAPKEPRPRRLRYRHSRRRRRPPCCRFL